MKKLLRRGSGGPGEVCGSDEEIGHCGQNEESNDGESDARHCWSSCVERRASRELVGVERGLRRLDGLLEDNQSVFYTIFCRRGADAGAYWVDGNMMSTARSGDTRIGWVGLTRHRYMTNGRK
jgi:hypothetical protein